MATRTFVLDYDALVASNNGTSLGAGADYHLPVGVPSGYPGFVIRSLAKFVTDFSGMYGISAAELRVTTTSSSAHGTKTADSMYVQRNTSGWSAGTAKSSAEGGSGWSGSNAVEWSNKPSTTTSGRATLVGTASHSTQRTADVLSIVKAWAPTTIPGGLGAVNYGITVQQTSETEGNYCEFWAEEGSGTQASIVVTYDDVPPQSNPTVTINSPAANGLARISNLADMGNFTCEVRFTYADANSHAMSMYRVKVFTTSGKTTSVYDSGDVTGSWATGTQIVKTLSGWYPTNGTDYWLEVTVWDSYSTPGSGSSTNQFRVRWGSAVFARQVGAGATSLTETISPSSPAANTQRAINYRLANAAYGSETLYTSWVTSLGALPVPDATYSWVHVHVGISSDLSGTNPQVGSYLLSFLASGGQPFPDKWAYSSLAAGSVALDPAIRRYGSRSLKVASARASASDLLMVWPVRGISGDDDIPVTPNTDYVFTCDVKTDGALTSPSFIYLSVYDGASYASGTPVTLDGAFVVDEAAMPDVTSDTSSFAEGWKRLRLTFRTGTGVTRVRPVIAAWDGGAANNAATFWLDGAMLTEGTVAPPFAQGTVQAAGTVGATGATLDGSLGAVFRLRGEDGGLRSTVELGTSGLVFGGDVEVSSPTAGIISIGSAGFRGGGTTFPANKSGGDRFFRTDLGMEFYWETTVTGGKWLSTQLFEHDLGGTQTASDSATVNNLHWSAQGLHGGSDLWLVSAIFMYRVASGGTALSGSHYWDMRIDKAADSATTLTAVASKSIQSGTADYAYRTTTAISALFGSSVGWRALITKTGTPGNLFCGFAVTYRVVAT